MNIQIFGTNKCFDTKKAQRYFKERGIKFQFIDLAQKNFSKGEYNSVKKRLRKNFLNTANFSKLPSSETVSRQPSVTAPKSGKPGINMPQILRLLQSILIFQ